MVVKLYEADGVKVFNVTADKVIPAWVSKNRGRKLSQDAEYARHIDLIQDFGFPSACHRIKATRDGQHIFTTGVHAPRVRVYDLHNLSMKFERHFDAEVVNFQVLTEDYEKCVFLCWDRTVRFHGKGGHHHVTRVPKFGRDMAYLPHLTDLLVCGSASEIWRINLAEGRFMTPLPLSAPAANSLGVAPHHGLLAAACDGGALECFDPRQRTSLSGIDAATALSDPQADITTVRFDNSGMYLAAGTSTGKVGVFDLRRARPVSIKDHMHDSPIVDIKFHIAAGDHTGQQRVISADTHILKVWDKDTGDSYTAIEPPSGTINDICVWPSSGLLMMATDSKRIPVFFVPSLGPAPRWCSFLESVVDDLEATGGSNAAARTIYDDFRFVTRPDIEKLQLSHLIGTPMLKAYMHGFFVDARLYRKATAAAQPFAYEEYRAKQVAAKLEEERQSRISMVRKLPKVNASTHIRLQAAATEAEEAGDGAARSKASKRAASAAGAQELLDDARFSQFFEDEDFAVDEDSIAYRELNPNAGKRKKSDQERLIEEHFQRTSEQGAKATQSSQPGRDSALQHQGQRASAEQGTRTVRMLEARNAASAELFAQGVSVAAEHEMPLGERDMDARPRSSAWRKSGGDSGARVRAAEEAAFKALDEGRQELVTRGRGRGRLSSGRGSGRAGGLRGRGRSSVPRGRGRGRGRR